MKIKKKKESIFRFFESINNKPVNIVHTGTYESMLVFKIIFYSCFSVSNYRRGSLRFSIQLNFDNEIDPFIENKEGSKKYNVSFGLWTTSTDYVTINLDELYKKYNFDEYSYILWKFESNNNQ